MSKGNPKPVEPGMKDNQEENVEMADLYSSNMDNMEEMVEDTPEILQ